jgi:hypothetical protein
MKGPDFLDHLSDWFLKKELVPWCILNDKSNLGRRGMDICN